MDHSEDYSDAHERMEGREMAADRAAETDAKLAEAVELLKSLEWSDRDDTSCPFCARRQDDGHRPDCRLSAFLGRVR